MGNVVIFKPSELCPTSALWIGLLMREAGFPPGVINILYGEGEVVHEIIKQKPVKTVYCAGLLYVETCARADTERVKRVFEVNVLGAIKVCQLTLPHLRTSKSRARINLISSAADFGITNSGWMSYCSSKAALSRYLQCLAHEIEESEVKIHGVYPRVTRTPMTPDMIAGNYKGIMRDEEVENFLKWDREGTMIEPPEWCGNSIGLLAADLVEGAKHGELLYYDKQVSPDLYKA